MNVDVILGVNIDTEKWIYELRKKGAKNILVIDYDSENKWINEDVLYLSPNFAVEYIKKFNEINYYKSLCAYPGMNGKMATLYKNKKEK
ncbi:hypothetical protein [Planococcus koreensis]|uniref:hypothetical protein n=1 Tax=Planococcus koreensis TaxID=112331 RepID=UPI0039FDDEB1